MWDDYVSQLADEPLTTHDECDLIELIVTTLQLARKEPEPTPSDLAEGSKKRGGFDYSVARAKLRVVLSDQLHLSRKQRKNAATKNDIKDALKEFFNKDGRHRETHGRTKTTVKPEVREDVTEAHPSDVPP